MKALILSVAALAAALGAAPAAAATNEELCRQVREAETAFAKSMAARDHAAFISFLADEVLFFSRTDVLRGRTAVADGWKAFFADADAPFSWEPEQVEVLETGSLAISSGPVRDPDGRVIATFNSIWRLEPDGRWRVIFDKACPVCEPPKK